MRQGPSTAPLISTQAPEPEYSVDDVRRVMLGGNLERLKALLILPEVSRYFNANRYNDLMDTAKQVNVSYEIKELLSVMAHGAAEYYFNHSQRFAVFGTLYTPSLENINAKYKSGFRASIWALHKQVERPLPMDVVKHILSYTPLGQAFGVSQTQSAQVDFLNGAPEAMEVLEPTENVQEELAPRRNKHRRCK